MIGDFLDKLLKRKITAQESIKQYIDSIVEHDDNINSFISRNFESALSRAKEIDHIIDTSDTPASLLNEYPLLGVPIAHKDIISTKDIETTAASNVLKGYIPPYDATIVNKMDSAGAIMLGKLNCDAFAHGASGENSDFGVVKNPYDKDRVAGGSSSGSGAAVASGFTIVATGTDTGGSLRNPASFTNTVAIKPTYGRVSRYGVIAMASSLDSVGHVTRTVKDSALVLQTTAGVDSNDASSANDSVDKYLEKIEEGVRGMKIGIPKEYFVEGLDPEINQAIQDNLKILEKAGAEIIEISLPHTEYALAVYYIITPSEVSSNLARFDGIRFGESRDKFGNEAKRRIMLGTYTLSSGYYDAYYLKAQKVRTLVIEDFKSAFKKVDMILAPVTPMHPPKIGENVNDPLKMYLMDVLTVPVNLAGLPALSVPAGFSKRGLPIGLQLIGKHFDESTLYTAGYFIEQSNQLYTRRPEL